MKILTGLVTGLIVITINQSVFAQQSNLSLSKAWEDGNGFTSFEWLSAKDNETIYSSAVYTEVNQNTLSIYNTYNRAPLGQYARCGGLGCDLGKGQLVATVKFERKGSGFIVREASSKAGFLVGAQCRLVDSYMVILECKSNKSPAIGTVNIPSIFRFAPGT